MRSFTQISRDLLTHGIPPAGPIPTAFDSEGVYPYLGFGETTGRPVILRHRAIVLEKDLVRVEILPGFGGKVHSLIEKTTGRESLFAEPVVRLVRMLPRMAFISGGLEVGFPISHTSSQIESVTVEARRIGDRVYCFFGERELCFGMRWTLKFSPGEEDEFRTRRLRLQNPGLVTPPWMSWSNVATPARADTLPHFPSGPVLSHGVDGHRRRGLPRRSPASVLWKSGPAPSPVSPSSANSPRAPWWSRRRFGLPPPARPVIACFALAAWLLSSPDANAAYAAPSFSPVIFPGPAIGVAKSAVVAGRWTLSTNAIAAIYTVENGTLRLVELRDGLSKATIPWGDAELFTVVPSDRAAAPLPSSAFKLLGTPHLADLKVDGGASCFADRIPGKALVAEFEHAETGLRVTWSAQLRSGANAVRHEARFTTKTPLAVKKIELFRVSLPGARLAGYTDGAPLVTDSLFFGVEHPMAKNEVASGVAIGALPRASTLNPGMAWTVSAGIGVYPEKQLRRSFLYYLERERAHPYRQYWHYNSWYDLNINRNDNPDPLVRMTEASCMKVVTAFDKELFQVRKTGLNGFVWDDGWDDWDSLWQFHKGFPSGFKNLTTVARKQGAAMGAWLSPWGGYGGSKGKRIEAGKKLGYETNGSGFSLGGPKYYANFRDVCVKMIRDHDLDYFKFDGIGGGTWASGAPDGIAGDLDNLVRLIGDLRAVKSDVFVNCTVGTWASPYWVRYADSIWRQGEDTSFEGKGDKREQWINYKDSVVYDRFASKSPLFPINSLMYHGLVVGPVANPGAMPKPAANRAALRHEIHMMCGYASTLGELYVTPDLMTSDAWDTLGETMNHARERASVLVDSHWIGGNPRKNEVYGMAAWHPENGGSITLRNPDDKPATFTIKLADAFELPTGVSGKYLLKSPWNADAATAPRTVDSSADFTVELGAFEVKTFDALPLR